MFNDYDKVRGYRWKSKLILVKPPTTQYERLILVNIAPYIYNEMCMECAKPILAQIEQGRFSTTTTPTGA